MKGPSWYLRSPGLLLAALLLVFALGGCEASFEAGDTGVSAEEVGDEAQRALNDAARGSGLPPYPEVTCPEDLDEEVGAKMTCFSTFDGSKHRLYVTVTSVEDGTVNMDFDSEGYPTR